jgi:acyl-coenzyme A synthetase/AMP-(fatty) acid ligase
MLVERIYQWAKRQPDKTAVIWNDVPLSYRAFSNAIRAGCDFFQREDLAVGRTAVVLVPGLLDAWIVVMALRSLGLNTICVRSIEKIESLKISDIACVVVAQTEAAVHNLAARAPSGAKVVAIPPSFYSVNDQSELLAFQQDGRPFGGHILYTSGTTGTYKKLMMRGEQEEERNRARSQVLSFDSNTICHGLDFELWNSIGFKSPTAIWYVGGCVVLDQRKGYFKNFFSHDVTFAMLLPWQLKALLYARGPSARPVDGFTLAVSGGFFPVDLIEQTIQTLTNRVTAFYGSTETHIIPLRSPFRTKDDLLWLPPTDEKLVQIVDENGRECPIGQEGEVRILLLDIDCHEYLDDEETSARVFRDGFFYPGDMAVRREDGRIRILGRTADVLVVQGEKLATAPLEQEIQRHLQVDEVCLFSGMSEQGHEELVVAIQSDRPIQKARLEAIASKFPRFEKVVFSIRKEFPRTEAGGRKTKRALLKKLVFEDIAGMGDRKSN